MVVCAGAFLAAITGRLSLKTFPVVAVVPQSEEMLPLITTVDQLIQFFTVYMSLATPGARACSAVENLPPQK